MPHRSLADQRQPLRLGRKSNFAQAQGSADLTWSMVLEIEDTTNTIESLIDRYHEDNQELPRPHLGISLLGHSCDRHLWLNFRWAVIQKHSGRLLRLFRRGQLEEDQVIKDLRAAGISINSRQTNVDFGSHISGSADGVITSGVPGAEGAYHVLEIKTHSRKSFNELVKKGVAVAKPVHYIQMQGYMLGLKIKKALYYSICKDDDRIYTETINFVHSDAQKAIDRGQKIALSEYMPEPISGDPSWYECKMCPAHKFCHETKMTEEVNCRTCAHSTPTEDSQWLCARNENEPIPVDWQHQGCDQHVLHPDLVPWTRAESSSPHEAVYIIDSQLVRNGEPDERVYSSKEIIANPSACALADDTIESLRDEFNARIVK